MKKNVLLVGGAGYIGSHIFVELASAGSHPVILDNFSGSNPRVIGDLETITGQRVALERGDASDRTFVREVLCRHEIGVVIHLAARKSIPESIADPVGYFLDNLGPLTSVLKAMDEAGCRDIIFSSTAAVYDPEALMPVCEESPLAPRSPYAISKRIGEEILLSVAETQADWRIAILRYFNPVGAHPSGRIGEDPKGRSTNLMPNLCAAASGLSEGIKIFGDDFATPDGTGVRDFIHVVDLAKGHVAAYHALGHIPSGTVVNLGTGRGHSVLELIDAFEKISGRTLNASRMPRRTGDIAVCWADADRAKAVLGWTAELTIEAMCEDSWRWCQARATR